MQSLTVRCNGGPPHDLSGHATLIIRRADFGQDDKGISRRPLQLHRPDGSPWWVLDNISLTHPVEIVSHGGMQLLPKGESRVVRRSLRIALRGVKGTHIVDIQLQSLEPWDLPQSALSEPETIKLAGLKLGVKERALLAAYFIDYFREFPHWHPRRLTFAAAREVVRSHPKADLMAIDPLSPRGIEHVGEKIERIGFDVTGDDKGEKLGFHVIGRGLITEDDYEVVGGALHVRLPPELRKR